MITRTGSCFPAPSRPDVRAALLLRSARARVDLAGDEVAVAVDVRGAGHARIEAADGTQDVDTLELLRIIRLFEQWRIQHGLFIRARLAPAVAGRCVPGGRREDLVVRDSTAVQSEVVREPAAAGAPEADADLLAVTG